ncbi:DMT family transporter [Thermomonas haemolytica]|uniref:EamA domain-containing membrane protein RarD n=1 Tax=Thermomonas haemolytica TaxID=141949 RepID=A0A4R3N4V2_9GAMM|nr:DMT family transporter [Thermomonas haemolytica]TCT23427.1 EamA domain-containing membrane protein RarD [Thermomonas haemolytica]TNY28485.1 EamA family transporter [Thermomonas haemolytica]
MGTNAAIRRQPRRAAWLMLVAVAAFALMDAGMKALSAQYPPLQVAALRGAASLPWVLAWALWTAGPAGLRMVRWPLHLLRGVLGVLMLASFVYALKRLPMSTAYAIFFVAPLLITALSVPILRERVGPRRWTAIAFGLLGVLVVLRPSAAGMFTVAGLAVLVAATCYALSAITVRVLARTDRTQAITVWLLAMMAGGAGALALPDWVALRGEHLAIVIAIGIAGALGQYAITEAFRLGEASLIAPLEYTALVWGVALDLAIWGVLPGAITWVGAAIIVASGLYLLRRERVHAEAEHP